MKLPLWCKGKTGKYHRFPYEQLQTLPNGRLGLCYYSNNNQWIDASYIIEKLCEETGWDANHFFYYSITMDAYILKGEPEEEPDK